MQQPPHHPHMSHRLAGLLPAPLLPAQLPVSLPQPAIPAAKLLLTTVFLLNNALAGSTLALNPSVMSPEGLLPKHLRINTDWNTACGSHSCFLFPDVIWGSLSSPVQYKCTHSLLCLSSGKVDIVQDLCLDEKPMEKQMDGKPNQTIIFAQNYHDYRSVWVEELKLDLIY